MLEFTHRALVEGCDYFIRTIQNELNLQENLTKEKITKLESYQKELKQELVQTKEAMEGRVRILENEKAHNDAQV